MKNILMIATYFPPMGGIGTVRVTKYVKYLKQYNWNPTVVTISNKYVTNKDESLLKDIPKDVNIKRLEFEKKHSDISIDFYKALNEKIDNIVNEKNYDCVFVTGGPFFILPIARKIYNKYKIPYIVDLRDPWKLQTTNENGIIQKIKSRIKTFIKGIFENWTFKYADDICTVNDTMTEEYKAEYPKYKDKIHTISNGFDIEDYENIKPKSISKFTITYSGKFETSSGFRNPRILFKSIKELNDEGLDINFVHIGKTEEKVKNIMKEENCEIYCEYVGLKSFNETLEYCKSSNILIAICGKKKNEQTGKIFDYICCERPVIVIAQKDCEINKVCENFNNIYNIEHEEKEELKNIIKKIYNNEVKYIKNDLKNSKYSRYKLTKELVDLLNKIER